MRTIFLRKLVLVIFLLSAGVVPVPVALAQAAEEQTQVLRGYIQPDRSIYYELRGRKAGETLYVLMTATSDNLDPFVALLPADSDLENLRAGYGRDLAGATGSADVIAGINAVRDRYFLAWDDDDGPGYAAALSYTFLTDGDYYLVLSSSATSAWQPGFGNYLLRLGVDEPATLTGAVSDNVTIGIRNDALSIANVGVQTLRGTLSGSKLQTTAGLVDIKAGDTVYLSAEPTSDSLELTVLLVDAGGKPLSTGSSAAGGGAVALAYTFSEESRANSVRVIGCCGDYDLTAGINAPDVLAGVAEDSGMPVLRTAIPVSVGIRMQQISAVDQRAENFGVVGTLRMVWTDPRLAFSPEECDCQRKSYNQRTLAALAQEIGDNWPDFTFFNQQGNRWTQNQEVEILPSGEVTYLERFSTDFQAPDFDFRRFPFDQQKFYIRIDALKPEDTYVFRSDETYTEIGGQLGEEEWYITSSSETVTSEESSRAILTSRYSFGFEARRHLSFYLLRIFVPIVVVIIVSWITFFLKDYDKRVDVAAGNLLLFIAFNFTISGDLPRLGYLTFMDVILISTFVIAALVVIFNVILKRLQLAGRERLAARLDTPMIWLYPLLYVVGTGVTYYHFFVQPLVNEFAF